MAYPSLKLHTLFYGNGLGIWHGFPYITHFYVNNYPMSAISNLIELTFFQDISLPEIASFVY